MLVLLVCHFAMQLKVHFVSHIQEQESFSTKLASLQHPAAHG